MDARRRTKSTRSIAKPVGICEATGGPERDLTTAPDMSDAELDRLFDGALARLTGWRRREVAAARREEGRFLVAQRRAVRA